MGGSYAICAVRLPIVEDIPISYKLDYIRDAFNHPENCSLVVSLVLSDPTVFECEFHPR
jgi:hypothetical protein